MSVALVELTKQLLQSKNNWKIKVLIAFPEVIGTTLKDHVSILKITDTRTIIVGVSNSCLLQELQPFSSLLCTKINQILDSPYIINVQFKLRPTIYNRKREIIERSKVCDEQIVLNNADKAQLEKVKDPELRSVLEAFAVRCQRKRDGEKNKTF